MRFVCRLDGIDHDIRELISDAIADDIGELSRLRLAKPLKMLEEFAGFNPGRRCQILGAMKLLPISLRFKKA